MINLLKLISSITLIVSLVFLNLQLENEKIDKSKFNSDSYMKVEVVDASTCKAELGGVCEKWSEWTLGQCNVVEEEQVKSAYPCKE